MVLWCAPSLMLNAAESPGWQTLAALEFPVGERLPFEETTVSRLLKRPVTATGELWLSSDGTLNMAIEQPRFERRALEQQFVTLTRLRAGADRDPNNPTDLVVRRLPIQAERPAQVLLRSIAQLMEGDIGALRENFDLLAADATAAEANAAQADAGTTMAGAAANDDRLQTAWELRLEPRAERLRRRLPQVLLQGTGERLLSIHADRGSQGSQTVRLLESAVAL